MGKSISDLKLVLKMQRVIWIVLLIMAVFAVFSTIEPLRHFFASLFTIVFYLAIFIVIPYALILLAMTIHIFRKLAKEEPQFRKMVTFTGWLSALTGAYALAALVFGPSVTDWARAQNHSLVVAIQSSPIVLGLALLAAHAFVARTAHRKLTNEPTA